jgi:hypothetical protein
MKLARLQRTPPSQRTKIYEHQVCVCACALSRARAHTRTYTVQPSHTDAKTYSLRAGSCCWPCIHISILSCSQRTYYTHFSSDFRQCACIRVYIAACARSVVCSPRIRRATLAYCYTPNTRDVWYRHTYPGPVCQRELNSRPQKTATQPLAAAAGASFPIMRMFVHQDQIQ